MKPIKTNIRATKTIPIMMNPMPLPICPLYICPKPMKMTERTAAIPGLFLSLIWTGAKEGGGGGGATLTPHFGQSSAFLSISAPQFWQNFVFLSLKLSPQFLKHLCGALQR